MRYDVFISYSSIDQKIAEGVCAYLEQRGIRCFVAYRDIPRGVVWATAIVEALEQSRMMVVLFSENFNKSSQVEREIELASNMEMPVLTFRLSNDAFRGAKKYYLQNLNWIDAFPHPERAFGALYNNVSSLLGIASSGNEVKKATPESRGKKSSNFYLWIVIGCLFIVLLVTLIFLRPRSESADDSIMEQAEIILDQGLKEFDNGNYAEAVKCFRKSAESGNAESQFFLGKCYFEGAGVEKDPLEAIKWFKESAEQGYAGAQAILGVIFYNGDVVPKDISKAVKWFKESAEQGYAGAQAILGVIFYNGDVVPKDISKAVKWFKEAARQGNPEAQYSLGVCYENGEGVSKDMVAAVTWYKLAAEQGHADAQCNLGVCYENGSGVTKDLFEAVIWYKKSAEQGDDVAQYNLGRCYENGESVFKDLSEAFKWYKKAAEQGNANAQYKLGVCYENGEGVSQDMAEAVKWYKKAADQGYEPARKALESFYQNIG